MTEFVLSSILLLVLLVAAYYLTRYASMASFKRQDGRIIKIVDRIAVSQDKMLLVVIVADKAMLIALSGNGAQKLCDLDEEKIMELYDERAANSSIAFQSILQGILKKPHDEDGESHI